VHLRSSYIAFDRSLTLISSAPSTDGAFALALTGLSGGRYWALYAKSCRGPPPEGRLYRVDLESASPLSAGETSERRCIRTGAAQNITRQHNQHHLR